MTRSDPYPVKAKASVRRGTFSVNVIAQVLSFSIFIGIGVLLTPYLIHRLGPAHYGLIPLALTLISYCGVLTVAINTSVSRSLTQAVERDDDANVNLIFSTSVVVCLVIACVVSLFLAGAAVFLDKLIQIPENGLYQARWLFGTTALSFVVSTVMTPFSVAAFCRNRFEITHAIAIIGNVVRVAGIVLFFGLFEPSIKWVGVAGLTSVATAALLHVIAWRHLMPGTTICFPNVQWSTFKHLFFTGVWVSVFQVGTILLLSVDLVLINHFFGPTSGGRYAAILQWSAMLRNFATSLAAVFTPTILGLHAKGDLDEVKLYALRAARFVGYSMSIPIGILCGMAADILDVWLGEDFTDLVPLMVILIGPLSINLGVLPLFAVSLAADKIKIPGLLTIGFGIMNVLLGVILVTQTTLGIYGVAISGVAVLTLKNVIFTPMWAAHNIDRPLRTFLLPLLGLLLATTALAGVTWVACQAMLIDTWFRILSVASCLSVLYSAAVYFLVMDAEDRKFVSDKLAKIGAKMGFEKAWANIT
ncbi:hypothetical protein [Novipirellula caenicola]|uniref:Membrane protein EpsK n=1 Tax=Novipirellula caenicola TaxID=1536901 RepID=A0ABP9W2P5_9BACT